MTRFEMMWTLLIIISLFAGIHGRIEPGFILVGIISIPLLLLHHKNTNKIKDPYRKCCLNCEYWDVESEVFYNKNGYCYRKFGAFTKDSFKCGHFEYAKALLAEMDQNNSKTNPTYNL